MDPKHLPNAIKVGIAPATQDAIRRSKAELKEEKGVLTFSSGFWELQTAFAVAPELFLLVAMQGSK